MSQYNVYWSLSHHTMCVMCVLGSVWPKSGHLVLSMCFRCYFSYQPMQAPVSTRNEKEKEPLKPTKHVLSLPYKHQIPQSSFGCEGRGNGGKRVVPGISRRFYPKSKTTGGEVCGESGMSLVNEFELAGTKHADVERIGSESFQNYCTCGRFLGKEFFRFKETVWTLIASRSCQEW